MTRALSAGLIVLCASTVVPADSWRSAAVKEVFCESRDWFVRIVPGKSIGDTVGFAGSPKGPFARAEFYRRQADRSYRLVAELPLPNPVAPVDFFVTDRGHLATLDNWHNMGYGTIAAFYSPDGRLIQSYELKDLFSADEIRAFTHSVSSIWWRQQNAYIRPGQQSLQVVLDDKGAELIFETETGAWQFCQTRERRHQCRTTNADRKWKGFVEPKPRR